MEKETSDQEALKVDQENRAARHFYQLLKACNDQDKPNPKARQELQRGMKDNILYQKLMQDQEGSYTVALHGRIESLRSSDTFKEVTRAKCQQLREELNYQSANPLERLAIEHIVLC